MTDKKPNLIHRFVSFILRRRIKKKLDKTNSEMKEMLIAKYGSWDKVPDWRKEHYGLD